MAASVIRCQPGGGIGGPGARVTWSWLSHAGRLARFVMGMPHLFAAFVPRSTEQLGGSRSDGLVEHRPAHRSRRGLKPIWLFPAGSCWPTNPYKSLTRANPCINRLLMLC